MFSLHCIYMYFSCNCTVCRFIFRCQRAIINVKDRYYRDVELKSSRNTTTYKQRFHRHIRLLHDNAPWNMSNLLTQVLKSEKDSHATPIILPKCNPRLFLSFFLKFRQFLSGHRNDTSVAQPSIGVRWRIQR